MASALENMPALEAAQALGILGILRHPQYLHHAHLMLSSRNLLLQLTGLQACLDRASDESVAPLEKWLHRNLRNRSKRANIDLQSMPVALNFFDRVGRLESAASMISKYEDQFLDETESVRLEQSWPRNAREAWLNGSGGERPSWSALDSWSMVNMATSGNHESFVQLVDSLLARVAKRK